MKAILREKDLTIKELSEKSNVPLNTLYSITRRDSKRVDRVILQQIADALDVLPGQLTGELVELKGPSSLRHALLLQKIFECAETENISKEALCIQLNLPFDEWYRWETQSSFSFLDHLPEIASILDVPRKTFNKFLDESNLDDDKEEDLLVSFRKLNAHGQEIAVERLQELCKIRDYIK